MLNPDLIDALSVFSLICAGLALGWAITATVIFFKYPPSHMMAIIHEARIAADPKHRKAMLQIDEAEVEAMQLLLQVPSTEALHGWIGTLDQQEVRK